MITRRKLVAGLGSGAIIAATPTLWIPKATAAIDLSGRQPLAMPPILDASSTGRFSLDARVGRTSFLGSGSTETIGFNQNYLGPILKLKAGETQAKISNSLNEAITVHWHGLLVPGEADGGPHQPIAPGKTWSPTLEFSQPPATLWYHSHIHGRTAEQVYFGLAGVLHIVDGRDADRGLPSDHGIDDLTLVFQDRRFDEAGRMSYEPHMMDVMHGFVGDTMLINGQANPVAVVPKGVVRLRLLNASNARIYTLSFRDKRPLHLAATDAGYLPDVVSMNEIRMGPGERAEILVDFDDGNASELISQDDPNRRMGGMMGRAMGMLDVFRDRSFTVLPFAVDDRLQARIKKVPAKFDGSFAEMKQRPTNTTRDFALTMGMGMGRMMGGMMRGGMRRDGMRPGGFMGINDRPFAMDRIDFEARANSSERWIVSSDMLAHPFHAHGVTFQVLSEAGRTPQPWNRGWKDTVLVEDNAELLVRFHRLANDKTPYMFHCHILEHEDAGMMGQFAVV